MLGGDGAGSTFGMQERGAYDKLFEKEKNEVEMELSKNTNNLIHIFAKITKLRMFCDSQLLIKSVP